MPEPNPGRPVRVSDPADAAAAAAEPAAAFCRSCGYSLRGLPSGKCPECGRAFDLADRRTVARRPPRTVLRWWAWRVGLLALVTILAAGSAAGWYGWQWHREQAAIAAVRGAGGRVVVAPIELGAGARFLPARWAYLHDRAVIIELRGDGTAVLDRIDLSPLVHVHYLRLDNCGVTDAALARLRGMAELENLDLPDNPRLGDTGLRLIAVGRALTQLDLWQSGLTDTGLADVGGLTTLRYLDIGRTPVTDAGMGHLAGLTSLRLLNLRVEAVTDAGLVPLRGLTSLRDLYLGGTKVTEQGRRDLKQALPNLQIRD